MDTNYLLAGAVAMAVVALVIYLVKRNKKDEKEFETGQNKAEIKAEKHEGEES